MKPWRLSRYESPGFLGFTIKFIINTFILSLSQAVLLFLSLQFQTVFLTCGDLGTNGFFSLTKLDWH